jgi:hypothetical protein
MIEVDSSPNVTAHRVREAYGYSYVARFPINDVIAEYGIEQGDADALSRMDAAVWLGKHLKVNNPMQFATELLLPLYLLDLVATSRSISTGQRRWKWFFGGWEVKRGRTFAELQGMFDVPDWVLRKQLVYLT